MSDGAITVKHLTLGVAASWLLRREYLKEFTERHCFSTDSVILPSAAQIFFFRLLFLSVFVFSML